MWKEKSHLLRVLFTSLQGSTPSGSLPLTLHLIIHVSETRAMRWGSKFNIRSVILCICFAMEHDKAAHVLGFKIQKSNSILLLCLC